MSELSIKKERELRRIKRIRKKVIGTPERPRLTFTRSNRHIYVQIIDDTTGKSFGIVTTNTKEFKEKFKSCKNKNAALELVEPVYQLLLKNNIKKIVFDSRGKKYHTVLKSFADKLREKGIEF